GSQRKLPARFAKTAAHHMNGSSDDYHLTVTDNLTYTTTHEPNRTFIKFTPVQEEKPAPLHQEKFDDSSPFSLSIYIIPGDPGSSRRLAMRKHKKPEDNKSVFLPVLIGVIITLVALVVIICLIIFIIRYRRKRAKLKSRERTLIAKPVRKMECEDLNRVKFTAAGPLKMDKNLQGPVVCCIYIFMYAKIAVDYIESSRF
ncbi:hypothetical protein GCK32_017307, partial [Trichostrongylus colubriformis]